MGVVEEDTVIVAVGVVATIVEAVAVVMTVVVVVVVDMTVVAVAVVMTVVAVVVTVVVVVGVVAIDTRKSPQMYLPIQDASSSLITERIYIYIIVFRFVRTD